MFAERRTPAGGQRQAGKIRESCEPGLQQAWCVPGSSRTGEN